MKLRWAFFLFFALTTLLITPIMDSSGSEVREETEYLPLDQQIIIDDDQMSIPEGVSITGNGTVNDPIIISGAFINNTSGPGIWINNSRIHIILKEVAVLNNIWNRTDGMFISNSTNITVVDSLFRGCYIGLHIDNSSFVNTVGCDLSNNWYGIITTNSVHINITDCSAFGNLVDGFLFKGSDSSSITYCDLISNSNRIGNDAAIRIIGSSDFTIHGCLVKMNYGTGIYLKGPMKNGTIFDCDINYNNEGIIIEDVWDLRVQGIEMIINMRAMVIKDLENGYLADCWIYRNEDGITMERVISSHILRMEMEECGFGLDLKECSKNEISGNIFNDVKLYDVRLGYPSADPDLTSGNQISSNHFGKNREGGSNVSDNGIENNWSKEVTGNIWGGSQITDLDADGIGDSPYLIKGSAGSFDEYPRSDMVDIQELDDEVEVPEPTTTDGDTKLIALLVSSISMMAILMISIMLLSKREH